MTCMGRTVTRTALYFIKKKTRMKMKRMSRHPVRLTCDLCQDFWIVFVLLHTWTHLCLAWIQAPWPAGSRGRTRWPWSWAAVPVPQTGTGLFRTGAAEMTSLQDRPASPGRAGSSGRQSAHRSALHWQGKGQHHTFVQVIHFFCIP